jgi:hypothetical protein
MDLKVYYNIIMIANGILAIDILYIIYYLHKRRYRIV